MRRHFINNRSILLPLAAVLLIVRPAFAAITQQAYLKAFNPAVNDFFGKSVALSGNAIIVGAPFESSDDTGAAYIFVRSGTNWTLQTGLKASNPGAGDSFGYRVAISGDTVVVGAAGESSNATGVNGDQSDNSVQGAGAAYVFVRSGSNWIQQAYLKASNPDSYDYFGFPVAISGDTIVVGAYNESSNATGVDGDETDNSALHSGAAYVFVRSGSNWTQQAYLKASNPDGTTANTSGDNFGWSLTLSGDTLVVGAPYESSNASGINGNQFDNSVPSAGAAYVFVRSGTNWTQQAYLKASNTTSNQGFGGSVSLSGDTVVVGAAGESSNASGVNGDQNNRSAPGAGAAYVFVRTGTNWAQQAYLKASNPAGELPPFYGDHFGISVGVSGDIVVIGAPDESSKATGVNGNQNDNSMPNSGAAYVFVRGGTTWNQGAYLKASNPDPGDYFADWVAVSGDTVVVGATLESSNATGVNGNQANNSVLGSGAAYIFTGLGNVLPQLAVVRSGSTILISWPSSATGFVLQSATTLAAGGDWQDSGLLPTEANGQKSVSVTPTGSRGFFRLRGP